MVIHWRAKRINSEAVYASMNLLFHAATFAALFFSSFGNAHLFIFRRFLLVLVFFNVFPVFWFCAVFCAPLPACVWREAR
jgi:hypothetical protein